MSKRLVTFFSILTLILTTLIIPANAAAKAGARCTKAGAVEVLKGKTYTCVKTGKKLLWNKGIVQKNPKSGVNQPSQQLFVDDGAIPTSFDNLYQNFLGIPSKIWNDAQSLVTAGNYSTNFEMNFGPNSQFPPSSVLPVKYLEKASKLWSRYKQPSLTKTFVYKYEDLNWVQQRNRELPGSWHKPEDLAGNCRSPQNCGSFGGAFNGQGQLFIGIPEQNNSYVTLDFTFHNLAHEYTHTVQYSQLNAPANVKLPCWFAEGQPQVIGHSLGFDSFADYKRSRMIWLDDPAGLLNDYSAESILKFYSLTGGSTGGFCNQDIRPRVYDIGYFTVEALAAIKGIESTMDLVVGIGNGLSFEDSFRKIYGISWSEAAPILAKVVSATYK